MNLRRAVRLNIVLYIATFVVAAIILYLKGMPLQIRTPPSGHQIFIAMVTGIVITVFGSRWYFRQEPAGARNGFMFGLTAMLTGFAMDAIVSIGMLMSGENPLSFLKTWYSLLFSGGLLITLLVLTSLVGWGVGKKNKAKPKAQFIT